MKSTTRRSEMNRRMVLRGAGGLMLGLPLLETLHAAQGGGADRDALAVRPHRGRRQRRGSGGRQLERAAREPERFWPTATGTLTKASMTADKATRSTGELADYADKLLIVKGINLPYSSNGCSHSAADAQILTAAKITPGSTNCKAMGISVDTAIAKAKNPAGRDPLVMHAGMFSPGGTGFDIPGYVSYVTPQQPRVYIDSPYKAYQADHRRGRERYDRRRRPRPRPRCNGRRAARASTTSCVRRSRRCSRGRTSARATTTGSIST